MATTLTAGNLVVKITESLTVNGKNYGNENTLTIATVKEPDLRIVTVPTSEKTLIAFGGQSGRGLMSKAMLDIFVLPIKMGLILSL